MKKRLFIVLIFCSAISFCIDSPLARADVLIAKLPYAKGESFVLSQGYHSLPTHIKKDAYALDFTQNGCDAYGKAVVAAASGTAMFVSEEGYNGGYGTELIVDHGDGMVSRYAHMVPNSITVALNDSIRQGEIVGRLGDTGLVAGAACADHPGTHLHFAMDVVNKDGTFSAYNPEPISGYINMTEEKWYLSDNGDDTAAGEMDTKNNDIGGIFDSHDDIADKASDTANLAASTTVAAMAAPVIASATPSVISVSGSSGGNNVPIGGFSITNSNQTPISVPVVGSVSPSSSSNISVDISANTQASSSTPVDPALATTTVITTNTTTSSVDAPDTTSSQILFSKTEDSDNSPGSAYDDNWFDLGNGFSGTLNTLTLEGKVDDPNYLASHIFLQEFKDPNYAGLIQQFTISDNAPFTDVMATATFSGLSITLKPYLYYRLSTLQDWQGRSVILAGTSNTPVGVIMWDNFIPGIGGVQSTSTYFPFVVMEGVAATSTLTRPPITTPTDLKAEFDDIAMRIALSFSTSTDLGWLANNLHYEMNYSTSTSLSDEGWTSVDSIPVTIGNSYLIGIRARDDFGFMSDPATFTWNFPSGFSPYLLSPGTDYAAQYFNVPATSTLQSIQVFTTNFRTGARWPDGPYCWMELYDSYASSSYGMTRSDDIYHGYGCIGAPPFSFASSSVVLYPSHHYQWMMKLDGAGVQFYGTATDTAGGLFSDPSLVNAKFVVNGDSGVLFEN